MESYSVIIQLKAILCKVAQAIAEPVDEVINCEHETFFRAVLQSDWPVLRLITMLYKMAITHLANSYMIRRQENHLRRNSF